ncbi:MAG: anti-sigma factor family protein [Planctomycetota bacterium]
MFGLDGQQGLDQWGPLGWEERQMKRGSMAHEEQEQLIRLAVDGELSPEQAEAFRSRLTEDEALRQALDAERHLRGAVARVMIEPTTAPAGLADDIRAALNAHASEHESDHAPVGVVGRIGMNAAESVQHGSRRRWFPRWAMAAGIMLLVGASVVIGLLGDALPGSFGRGSAELVRDRSPHSGSDIGAAASLSAEQERASLALVEGAWRSHRMLTQADHAREFIRQNLELDFEVHDLRAFGYRFDGLAATRVADPLLGSTDLLINLRYVPVRTMPGVEPAEVIHHWTYADGVQPSALADLQNAARPRVVGKPYLIELQAVTAAASSSSSSSSAEVTIGEETSLTTRTQAYFAWIDPVTRLEKWLGPAQVPGAHTMAIHAGMPSGPVTRISLDDR